MGLCRKGTLHRFEHHDVIDRANLCADSKDTVAARRHRQSLLHPPGVDQVGYDRGVFIGLDLQVKLHCFRRQGGGIHPRSTEDPSEFDPVLGRGTQGRGRLKKEECRRYSQHSSSHPCRGYPGFRQAKGVSSPEYNSHVIKVVQGDLPTQAVAAIVNAANENLQHGGGVAAAIVKAGGRVIQDESDEWVAEHGPIGPGRAAITSAGALPARYVIHVVGPRYQEGQDNETLLRQAVTASLDAAALSGSATVAMPAISAGIFGYPLTEASRIIVDAARTWLDRRPGLISEVRLVGYDEEAAEEFRRALQAT